MGEGRTGKLEGHGCPGAGSGKRRDDGVGIKWQAAITSHVFLALKHDEAVAAVGFLFLVSLLVGMCITDDADLCVSARGIQ